MLTWVRAPRGPLAFPSQSCTRTQARLTCRPPRLATGPPWLARAPRRRPSPSQTAPPHPSSSPRPPPAPRPPRRTRTAPAELQRTRRPGAWRRRTHCAGAGRRRGLAARAEPGAAHLEGGARTRYYRWGATGSAQTRPPVGAEQGREDERRVAGVGIYSCSEGRLPGTILTLCPRTLRLLSRGLASCGDA